MTIDTVLANHLHYTDVIISAMAFQITSLTIVNSTVYSGADQRKHQSSASLAFYAGNSPVTGEFPAQKVPNAENVSIWWRHHGMSLHASLGARSMSGDVQISLVLLPGRSALVTLKFMQVLGCLGGFFIVHIYCSFFCFVFIIKSRLISVGMVRPGVQKIPSEFVYVYESGVSSISWQ